MLELNLPAPNFSLPDQTGKVHQLADYLGKWVVLYFYPKDDTPGCTKEACDFRDNYHSLLQKGVEILGVSKDSVESHQKFASKYSLNFPLLADPDKKIIETYQAWGEKKLMGRTFEGVKRITYVIDPKGMIRLTYDKVNPLTHSNRIAEDLSALVS